MARGRDQAAVLNAPVEGRWELPEGWRWERLGNIATPSKGKYQPDPKSSLPFVGLDSIAPQSTRLETVSNFSEMKSTANAFSSGQILYGRLRPYLNKVWLADRDGACSGEFIVLNCAPDIEPAYLRWILHHSGFVSFASHAVSGDRPRIDFKTMSAYLVSIPPLDTQRRIMARIDELFSELEDGETALARAREDLEIYRKALLKAAVTGELTADWRAVNPPKETGEQLLKRILAERRARWEADPKNKGKRYKEPAAPDTSGLPELPEGWAWMTLGQLGIVSGGLTKNAKRANNELQLPYLRVGNVYAGRFDLERVETIGVTQSDVEKTLLQKGDLLIVEGNGSIDQIGRCAVWDGAVAPCLHQNHLIKVRFSNIFWSYWALAWLSSPHGRKELQIQASSTSGLHTLSISKIDGIKLPLPPTEEIEAILSTINEQLHTSDPEQEIDTFSRSTASLRQSILAAAFKGELVQ